MDYPNDKEVLESFACTHPLSVSYHTAHISRTARALASSTKTSLRIDDKGLLSLQFLMPNAGVGGAKKGTDAFIEFRVSGLPFFCFVLFCFVLSFSCVEDVSADDMGSVWRLTVIFDAMDLRVLRLAVDLGIYWNELPPVSYFQESLTYNMLP
jgi:hypothetical protein